MVRIKVTPLEQRLNRPYLGQELKRKKLTFPYIVYLSQVALHNLIRIINYEQPREEEINQRQLTVLYLPKPY